MGPYDDRWQVTVVFEYFFILLGIFGVIELPGDFSVYYAVWLL
jgi:hypothetical protein